MEPRMLGIGSESCSEIDCAKCMRHDPDGIRCDQSLHQ